VASQRDPGWYADPGRPGHWRWWDGQSWTEHAVSAGRPEPGQAYGEEAEPARRADSAVFAKRWATLAALVILVVILLVIVFRGHPPTLYWQGEPLGNASTVLSRAEAAMQAAASADEGALSAQSRCYFSLRSRSDHDVSPYLRCGPILLPWSSPSAPWLTYPLSASPTSSGAEKLSLASLSSPASTSSLAKGEVLRRPDGITPQGGTGGLAVPEVPRQRPGWAGVLNAAPAGLQPAPAGSLVGDWGQSYRLLAFGEVSQLSSRLDPVALSAAVNPPGSAWATSLPDKRPLAKLLLPSPGDVFVVAQLALSPGEAAGAVPRDANGASAGGTGRAAADQPVLQVLTGTSAIRLPAVPSTAELTLVAAVPSGSEPLLGVSDKGLTQTVSLTNGQLGEGPSVLSRAGADEVLSVSGRLVGITVRFSDASLVWFAGSDGGTVPPATDEAYLQVLAWVTPLSASFLPASDFTLDEPGGQVIRAVGLPDSDRQATALGFLVPASFSDGTVVVSSGGQHVDVEVHFT